MLIHRRIFDLIKGVELYILSKSFIGLLINLSYIVQALIMGKIVGQLYLTRSLSNMKFNLMMLIVILIIRMVLIWFNHIYGKWIIGKMKTSLRIRLYDKLLKLGPGYLTDNRTGKIESTVVAGINYLEGYFSLYIPQTIVCIVCSSAIVIHIFSIHIVLGFLSLITALLALFAPVFFTRVISQYTGDHWQAYSDLNAEFVDVIQGMRTLKAYNAAERKGVYLGTKTRRLFDKTMRSLRVNLSDIMISNLATTLGSSFTLAVGAFLTAKGEITFAQLSVLLFLTTEVYRPINELAAYFHQGFMGMTSADSVVDILDAELMVKDTLKSAKLSNAAPKITFLDMGFSYNKKDIIFNQLNLNISSAQSIALVGESGSGKTSLIRLLLRYYEVDCGQILYNGVNIKEIPLEVMRKHIALVSQESYLFNGTIEFNLKLAKEDMNYQQMVDVCKQANIHDDIMAMPNGYQTEVGEMGLGLSGGQRQRLAIARAILKDTPLIILDEPTSSVDVESENLIKDSLEHLFKDKTTITIAHRLSTIKNADSIIVLDKGKLIESGSHDVLMANKAAYYKLVNAQFGETYAI